MDDEEVTCIDTNFGKAFLNNSGYYRLSNNKLLHIQVWEDYYGTPLPSGYEIHHKNHDRTDNRIENLELLSEMEHRRLHHKGKVISDETKIYMSKLYNTTNYFRVNIKPCENCQQGFVYRYQYTDEFGKKRAITDTSLKRLSIKVQAEGLPWKKVEDL